jgi:hypothetical protein
MKVDESVDIAWFLVLPAFVRYKNKVEEQMLIFKPLPTYTTEDIFNRIDFYMTQKIGSSVLIFAQLAQNRLLENAWLHCPCQSHCNIFNLLIKL